MICRTHNTGLKALMDQISNLVFCSVGSSGVTLEQLRQLIQKDGWDSATASKWGCWWVKYASERIGWTDFGDTIRVPAPYKA